MAISRAFAAHGKEPQEYLFSTAFRSHNCAQSKLSCGGLGVLENGAFWV